MLFYNFESLDEFIENNMMSGIQSESDRIKNIINLYQTKKNNLDILTDTLINNSDYINKKNMEKFYEINQSLKNSFEELDNIYNLAVTLDSALINIMSLYDKDITNNYNEIKAELIEFDKKSDHLYNIIFNYENLITSIFSEMIKILPHQSKKFKNQKNNIDVSSTTVINTNIELTHEDNNLLLISEKLQKAYLPYYYEDVKKVFLESKDKYKVMQDVVNSLYILPLDKFKNSSISRFREAFYLMRKKENQPISKALDLGLELMFKHELNPIIISACRNLDELDIYLDCLDKNELFDFNCFNIKFEVTPNIKN